MSTRVRRQELRRATTHSRENSQNSAPKQSNSANFTFKSSTPKTHSKNAFSVTTQPDGTTVQSTDLGLPSREMYTQLEDDYIKSLSVRKQEKALLTQQMFDHVWDVLHDPDACKVGTPQFRWWVRKMFVLAYTASNGADADLKPVVMHEDRPVVVKDQIYDVLSYCHLLANHGGRDRTTAVVREHYSWVPKELVARFVKVCPTCTFKRTGTVELSYPSDCTNTVPAAPGQSSTVTATSSQPPSNPTGTFVRTPPRSNSPLTADDDPASMSRALRWSMRPAATGNPSTSNANPSGVNLPPLRSLFPTSTAVPEVAANPYSAQARQDAAIWLDSLASHAGPMATSSLRGTFSESSSVAPPALVGVLPDSNPLHGTAHDSAYRSPTDEDDKGVLAIDPALLSEDANASQLHLIQQDTDPETTPKRHARGPSLEEYMYTPPLGRYTYRTEDD